VREDADLLGHDRPEVAGRSTAEMRGGIPSSAAVEGQILSPRSNVADAKLEAFFDGFLFFT